MINHARTLLLNRSGSTSGFISRAGEEFIPPDFRKLLSLPSYIVAPHRVLFGPQSDWLFENYRLQQYMSLLHSTELAEFVTALDPRVTYDPERNSFFSSVFGTTTDKPGLRFVGTTGEPDGSGVSLRRWRISRLDSTTVRINQLVPTSTNNEVTHTNDDSWSSLIPLGSSTFFITLRVGETGPWLVDQKLRPDRSLGVIASNLEYLTPTYWNDLFGVGQSHGNTEPWPTFRNLWQQHNWLPYRLGGFLLALIYSTERVRASNG